MRRDPKRFLLALLIAGALPYCDAQEEDMDTGPREDAATEGLAADADAGAPDSDVTAPDADTAAEVNADAPDAVGVDTPPDCTPIDDDTCPAECIANRVLLLDAVRQCWNPEPAQLVHCSVPYDVCGGAPSCWQHEDGRVGWATWDFCFPWNPVVTTELGWSACSDISADELAGLSACE